MISNRSHAHRHPGGQESTNEHPTRHRWTLEHSAWVLSARLRSRRQRAGSRKERAVQAQKNKTTLVKCHFGSVPFDPTVKHSLSEVSLPPALHPHTLRHCLTRWQGSDAQRWSRAGSGRAGQGSGECAGGGGVDRERAYAMARRWSTALVEPPSA